MRIAYCTNVRLPSERAYGYQIASVCDALASLGHDVMLFAPLRKNPIQQDYWQYYHANRDVKITYMGSFDFISSLFFPGILGLFATNWMLHRLLLKEDLSSFDMLYTRVPALLGVLLQSGVPVALELHRLPNRNRRQFVQHCNRCRKIVCLTHPMKDELVSWGVPDLLIIVEGDGVDLSQFASLPSRESARKKWRIPPSSFVLGYAGSITTMGLSKGVDQIVEAARRLHEQGEDVRALIAGGPDNAVDTPRKNAADYIYLLGTIMRNDVCQLYAAADVLIYPAPKTDHPYFMRDTSPLKVFEYMAAEKPIIAADITPIHDILDDSMATFYHPGGVESLVNAILQIRSRPDEAREKVQRAARHVQNFAWDKRMQRILDATIQSL